MSTSSARRWRWVTDENQLCLGRRIYIIKQRLYIRNDMSSWCIRCTYICLVTIICHMYAAGISDGVNKREEGRTSEQQKQQHLKWENSRRFFKRLITAVTHRTPSVQCRDATDSRGGCLSGGVTSGAKRTMER